MERVDEAYAIRRYQQAAALLPLRWQRLCRQVPEEQQAEAEELRLRAGQTLTLLLRGGEVPAARERPYPVVTQTELEQLCDGVTDYSRYAAADTLSRGYLTARGGFRIGVCGTAVLRAIGDNEMPDFTGKQVVVIGGGNVAMDVTRSSIRLGADKVTCVYRRRQADMTALPDEITGALAEGAELMTLAAPVRIEADEDGAAKALWVQPQIIGEVDKAGRPRPGKAALEEVRIPADVIVVAIGQGVEIQGFDQAGVPIQRGAFVAGLSGQVRDMDSVFAGGDCVTGPATAIRAIAAGKVAAANIDEHLGFRHEITVDVEIPSPKLNNSPPHGRIDTTEREACERKHDFEDIECGLTQEGACAEAGRCLRCDHFGYGIFRGGRNEKW